MSKEISSVVNIRGARRASGRKPTKKAEATRQQILDAAAVLFAEKGYGLTFLGDIANKAGIHLTALYYYYDNKEELVSDIICEGPIRTATALREALDAMPADIGARGRIETAFSVYLNCILHPDDHARASFRISSQISPEIRERAKIVTSEINDIWRKLLEEGVASGEIRADLDLTMVRMLMLGAMNWALEWFKLGLAPPAHLANVLKSVFFEGVAPGSS